MYTSIEIDFDVFKELTIRRKNEGTSENDVLRELLGLGPARDSQAQAYSVVQTSGGIPWVSKGVTFPHGTEFRVRYSGREYHAKVENGVLVYNETPYKSPSAAAAAVTGHPTSGWVFWECKMPKQNTWVSINKLRKN
jgi:hypothetical protein